MARAIAWDKDRYLSGVQSEIKYETGAVPALKPRMATLMLISLNHQ